MAFSIKAQIKRSFARFCEGTSCHGYVELLHAKAIFWSIFWVIVCGVALGLTVQLMYGSVMEYLTGSSDTVISTATESQILYPPLYLCYPHWLQWVDFDKIANLDKEAVLAALNYLTPIFSQLETLDVDAGRAKLGQVLSSLKLATLFSLYNYIARPIPINATTNLSSYFDRTEIIFKDPITCYCYVMSSSSVFRYFAENTIDDNSGTRRKLLSFSTFTENYEFNKNNVGSFVKETEYRRYMLQWITDNTNYVTNDNNNNNTDKLSKLAPPIKLLPNGFDDNVITVLPEVDDYFVNFRTTTNQWLPDSDRDCDDTIQSIASNETCELACLAHAQNKTCTCMDLHMAAIAQSDYPDTVCRFEIYSIDARGEILSAPSYSKSDNKTPDSQECGKNFRQNNHFQNCTNSCPVSCNIWNYDISVIATPMSQAAQSLYKKYITDINVQYPMANDVFVMTEEVGQSWETFVGNVGGCMGVWTGASIISLVQLMYLCCCYEIDSLPRCCNCANKTKAFEITKKRHTKRRIAVESDKQNVTDNDRRNTKSQNNPRTPSF